MVTHLSFTYEVKTISEANNYDHWREKHKRKKDIELRTLTAIQNAIVGTGGIKLPCHVSLTRIGPKKLDSDNLANSFKQVEDTIAKKLGVDDGDTSKITWSYHQEPCGKRQYHVKVEIKSCLPKEINGL